MMRIGLFGGTFNPIHFGHLRSALEIKEEFDLKSIYLIPSSIPPHKQPAFLADAKDRYEMIKLAVSNSLDFTVSDVELKRHGPSYTIDTIRYFKSIMSDDTKIFLILGIDAFLEIDTWKSYEDIFLNTPLIVMMRPGLRDKDDDSNRKVFENFLKSRISAGYRFADSKSFYYMHDEKKDVFLFKVTTLDISSTKIRKILKEGKSINFLLPDKVNEFIKYKGLYI